MKGKVKLDWEIETLRKFCLDHNLDYNKTNIYDIDEILEAQYGVKYNEEHACSYIIDENKFLIFMMTLPYMIDSYKH